MTLDPLAPLGARWRVVLLADLDLRREFDGGQLARVVRVHEAIVVESDGAALSARTVALAPIACDVDTAGRPRGGAFPCDGGAAGAAAVLGVPATATNLSARARVAHRCAAFAEAVRPGLVVVAEAGCLAVKDEAGVEVGRVDLQCGDGKDAHDVIVEGDVAYLLDDIYQPIFVFTVDVSRPTAPRVIGRADLSAVNAHLKAHWRDAAARRWHVVSESTTMGGSDQFVATFTDDALADAPRRTTQFQSSYGGPGEGVWMSAFGGGARPYAIARDGDALHVFRADASGARFEQLAGELPSQAPDRPVPLRIVDLPDGGLFVVDGTRGLVVDPGPPARVVSTIALPRRFFQAVVRM